MPELPEVEVTCLALAQELTGRRVERVDMRASKLRLPIPEDLSSVLPGTTLHAVTRRGKYLLLNHESGWLIIHLGMSGHLRVLPSGTQPGRHDHLDIIYEGGSALRYHDPRRFGTIIWTTEEPLQHTLLAGIGPEPLEDDFNGIHLFKVSRGRTVAVKQFVMNSAIVAGVGNIYANEALFRAAVLPVRPAGSLDREECGRLVVAVREVLAESIVQGSTITDFRVAEEPLRYHRLDFAVYGRGGEPCRACGGMLQETRLGNRSTVFCPVCQR